MPLWTSSREDRSSRELRAHLRWEHNAEIGWLLAQIQHRRKPLGRRLLAWIRRRKAEASARRTLGRLESRDSEDILKAARPGPPAIPIETRGESVSVDACEHPALLAQGSGGGTSYWQCSSCEGVVVMRGGGVWIIRPEMRMEKGAESTARAATEQGADRAEEDTLGVVAMPAMLTGIWLAGVGGGRIRRVGARRRHRPRGREDGPWTGR